MNTRQFCVWLKGIYDVMSIEDENFTFTDKQMALIKKNLNDVFTHELDDNVAKNDTPTVIQDPHDGSPPPFSPAYKPPGKTLMRC